jgi:hypothetical protein
VRFCHGLSVPSALGAAAGRGRLPLLPVDDWDKRRSFSVESDPRRGCCCVAPAFSFGWAGLSPNPGSGLKGLSTEQAFL